MSENEEIKTELVQSHLLFKWLSYSVYFCYMDTARHQESAQNNFLLQVYDDILASCKVILNLTESHFYNSCKRELRFLMELTTKASFIVEKIGTTKSYEDQIISYQSLLNSHNINYINQLQLEILPAELRQEFITEVKREYGLLCKYVHSSFEQMQQRLSMAGNGLNIGDPIIDELRKLNLQKEKVYAAIVVLLCNSIPTYVVGDLMVNSDGSSLLWPFSCSRFIASIDAKFDYKFERQSNLATIKSTREENIKY